MWSCLSAVLSFLPTLAATFTLDGSLMTGLIGLNAERKEIKTGCMLRGGRGGATADYTYRSP